MDASSSAEFKRRADKLANELRTASVEQKIHIVGELASLDKTSGDAADAAEGSKSVPWLAKFIAKAVALSAGKALMLGVMAANRSRSISTPNIDGKAVKEATINQLTFVHNKEHRDVLVGYKEAHKDLYDELIADLKAENLFVDAVPFVQKATPVMAAPRIRVGAKPVIKSVVKPASATKPSEADASSSEDTASDADDNGDDASDVDVGDASDVDVGDD